MTRTLSTLCLALATTAATAPPASATLPPDTLPGLRITVLYDNTVADARLRAGWGFSALIERGGHTLLLDAGGQADIFLGNAAALRIDLARIEAVAISHAHGDHTGGLPGLVERGVRVPLFALPSFPAEFRQQLGAGFSVRDVVPGQELVPGVFTTGEMVDPAVRIPEQALVIPTDSGLVVVTGCGHQGAVATVRRAAELFRAPVYLVLGGFHLLDKPEPQVLEIIAEFRRLGVRKVGATHCTGERAIELFATEYGADFVRLGAGRVLAPGEATATPGHTARNAYPPPPRPLR
jgi:7,8-dihydropterin-6-yl-methyl-4-(beta-D-ribofuranosyl)aminobenzene 5'-phosphate synthase